MLVDYRHKKFLVVDDFPEFRSALRFMLQSFGVVSIDTAGSGEAAIDLIEKKPYDVILCDYNLGYQQKDGQQILEEAKHRQLITLTTVFIMITAENTPEMVMGVAEYYPDDYLIKPFTKDILRTRIEKAFRKKNDFELIESAIQKKAYRQAITLCEARIKESPPNLFEYIKLKGDLLLQIGDYDGAKDLFEEVLSVREIPWAKIGIGRAFFYKEEYSQARQVFHSLIEENKMHIVGYDWLAKTFLKLNAIEEARNILQEAVDISPKSVNRQKLLGEIALQNQNYDQSEKAFKSAIEFGRHSCFKNPTVYIGLAKVLVNKKEPEKAISTLNDIQKEFKENTEAAFQAAAMKGVVYQTMNQKEESKRNFHEAARLYEGAVKDIPQDILIDLAKSCLEMGEKEEGLKLIQDVIRNNHDDDVLLRKVQTVFNDTNLSEEGQQFIDSIRKEIIRINNQGVRLVKEGRLPEAIECFEKAAQSMPGNKIIVANAAEALFRQIEKNGKDKALLRQAKGYLDRLQKIDPEYKKIPHLLEWYERFSLRS